MSSPARRIDRAIRLTPRADRTRYAAEWRHDLAAADAHGLSPGDVGRGASQLAIHLRARQIGRLLLGGHGVALALRSWLALVALLVVSSLLGGTVLLISMVVLTALVVVLARAGTPSHLKSEHPAAAWGGLALVLVALSALTLLASAVVATTRERRVRR